MSAASITATIIFAAMIATVLIGVPVYISVISFSALGLYLTGGKAVFMQQFSTGILSISSSYTFSVIPLFLIVGVLAGDTGMGESIFEAAKKWLGRLRGGLLYTVVGANAIFGACSGVSTAGTVVFTKIAVPELKKAGYDETLSYGCIASAGCLSSLIPPSVGILTFCLLTEISIGTGLICGFATGLIMVVVMFLSIFILSVVSPKRIPRVTEADSAITWRERLKSLQLLIPVGALFALVIGGAFFGWFPPTVGGAIAAIAIIIYALAKRMPAKKIFLCVWDGAQTFAIIFLIVMGSQLLGRFIAITGLAKDVAGLIVSVGLSPFLVALIIVVFYGICGCVMDAMAILLITVPVVYPLMIGLGFNGFVVCIMLVLMAELGSITPPFGMSVFTMATVLKESTTKIFKGVWPFIIVYLVVIFIALLFPEAILWLPRLMGANV